VEWSQVFQVRPCGDSGPVHEAGDAGVLGPHGWRASVWAPPGGGLVRVPALRPVPCTSAHRGVVDCRGSVVIGPSRYSSLRGWGTARSSSSSLGRPLPVIGPRGTGDPADLWSRSDPWCGECCRAWTERARGPVPYRRPKGRRGTRTVRLCPVRALADRGARSRRSAVAAVCGAVRAPCVRGRIRKPCAWPGKCCRPCRAPLRGAV